MKQQLRQLLPLLATFRAKIVSAKEMCENAEKTAELSCVSSAALLGCCLLSFTMARADGEGALSVLQVARVAGVAGGAVSLKWSRDNLQKAGKLMESIKETQDCIAVQIKQLPGLLSADQRAKYKEVLEELDGFNTAHGAGSAVITTYVAEGLARTVLTDVLTTSCANILPTLILGEYGALMAQIAVRAGGPGLIAGASLSTGGAAVGGLAAASAALPAVLMVCPIRVAWS